MLTMVKKNVPKQHSCRLPYCSISNLIICVFYMVYCKICKRTFITLVCLQDSLAAEIEGTMRRELSVEEESAFQDQRYNNQI